MITDWRKYTTLLTTNPWEGMSMGFYGEKPLTT
jgi:hypothetical protein